MKVLKTITSVVLILLTMTFVSCDETTTIESQEKVAPVIDSFEPMSGVVGTQLSVTGKNLEYVDHITVGGGEANILFRVNGSLLIAEITKTSRDGKVTLINSVGESTSESEFQITYSTPKFEDLPSEASVYSNVLVNGENLNFVDSIMIAGIKSTIVSQTEKEIVFEVPFYDSEDPTDLEMDYYDGSAEKRVVLWDNAFVVTKKKPLITSVPTSVTKYNPVLIEGENLDLFDAFYVGDLKLTIISQSSTEVFVDVPTDHFEAEVDGALTGVYYGVKTMTLIDTFSALADPNEPRYYTHNNVLLSARIKYGGTEKCFYDCETGAIYHSCDAQGSMKQIDFFLYDQSGYVQLYAPYKATNTVKNYKCDGVSIDPRDGTWNAFYGAEGTVTKFRVLQPDDAEDARIIDAYNAGTIVYLNDEFFGTAAIPDTGTPKIFRTTGDKGWKSSYFAINDYSYGWVRNETTGKNGIIHFTDMPQEAVNGRIPELKFDIIWQK